MIAKSQTKEEDKKNYTGIEMFIASEGRSAEGFCTLQE